MNKEFIYRKTHNKVKNGLPWFKKLSYENNKKVYWESNLTERITFWI